MSTYFKFIVIAALFLSTGAASVLGQSASSSSSTTEQKIVEQSTSKSKEVKTSMIEDSDSTTKSSQTAENSSQSTEQSNSEKPEALSASEEASSAVAPVETTTDETTRPAPTINEAEPNNTATPEPATQNAVTPEPVAMQANQLKIGGQMISYLNAGQGNGQAIIDANPNLVATWGGASVQSGNDGANTHFIGHNPGIFNVLFSVGVGETIDISDSSNYLTTYTVSQIVTVNDSGVAADGTDYWDQITGSGGGERISLQTCINDDYNLIVFASK